MTVWMNPYNIQLPWSAFVVFKKPTFAIKLYFLWVVVGGNGLKQDKERAYELYQNAAEAAMAATKGRLANKYYELAESL